MENIDKTKEVAITLYNPQSGIRGIDIRRKMLELPEVAKSLNDIDKLLFVATTKTLISDIDDYTLVTKTSQMFGFIAMDVGYKIPTDATEWQYICTRLFNMLKRYYSYLTLAEIKFAFELATMGELNEYLPKDGYGKPDKNHYQQFNVDYFAKILNAYKQKRNIVIEKALDKLPPPQLEMTNQERLTIINNIKRELIVTYLTYKYCGYIPDISPISEMLFYDELVKIDIAEPMEITEAEKRKALSKIMMKIAGGRINKYAAQNIRELGYEHDNVKNVSYWIARRKALIATFDEMIKDEVQILNIIKLNQ